MDDIRHDDLAITASDNPRANAPDSSPKPQKARSIEVDEDMAWQRWTWAIQRLGWLVMGGLVLTALTGVFGYGPVSWQQASDPAGLLRVEYERFERQLSEHTLKVDIAPGATTGGDVALRLNGEFLDAAEVREIVPEPRETRSLGSDVEYVFPVTQSGRPATIRFVLKLRAAGAIEAEVGLSGREPARFTQFVYP
ncbi:hypothetical protein [Microvirga subterranea]|uniref:Uncharacterized protein n=1 Tax=Microvirga subterranea TaxID=186651 RepID=A0A370H864_9HYPH|nr:hypothetical protein [Microvirga subterranea]RDI50501.1 hypothetical protein DES45_12020 [Microvirga subterranea]